MSPLDVNQSDKGNTERIVVKAFETPGNSFAGGIIDTVSTKDQKYDYYLMDSFFFPVDSCIWDIGCTWSSQVNKENNGYPQDATNAEGWQQIGISMFSTRDKLWDGVDGMTPMTAKQKMARDPTGGTMDWSITPIPLGPEIALRNRGYLNKAVRQLLYFNQVSSGHTHSKTINMTKLSKHGKRKRATKRAFDVDAGTKLVFWSRNIIGGGEEDFELNLSAQITPRIKFFPKQNIIQNFEYEDQAQQRWGSNTRKTLLTDQGDGVQELWTTETADSPKK